MALENREKREIVDGNANGRENSVPRVRLIEKIQQKTHISTVKSSTETQKAVEIERCIF